ncbi:MAG: hypothetical protein ACI9YT_001645 [Halobacteriales archaeon]
MVDHLERVDDETLYQVLLQVADTIGREDVADAL